MSVVDKQWAGIVDDEIVTEKYDTRAMAVESIYDSPEHDLDDVRIVALPKPHGGIFI